MNDIVLISLENLQSSDKARQDTGYTTLMKSTAQSVDWAYDIWDALVKLLTDKDNRRRAIAAQVLCNLAKSDPGRKMLRDFPALFDVVTDERFVTLSRRPVTSLFPASGFSRKTDSED